MDRSIPITAARIVAFALAIAVVLGALVMDLVRRVDHIGVDFHTYYAAALVGLRDGWPRLYDQPLVEAVSRQLAPHLWAQPFLSPPPVAWLVTGFTALPYRSAYVAWAALMLGALAASLACAGTSRGVSRLVVVAGALSPWWVMHSVNVGQVVPLVAAGTVVAWRLVREDRQVAAGLALALILLKPNTAILVPVALLFAGRTRSFTTWAAAAAVVTLVAAAMLGPHGLAAYAMQLAGPLPNGADDLTIHGALGATGVAALLLRLAIVGGVAAGSFRLRATPALAIPLGIVGSLLTAPYLHASDLCLLVAAAWMVWEERPVAVWRVPLAAGWVLASPYLYLGGVTPGLNRWPWLELAFFCAIAIAALRPLTGWAFSRRRAPA